MLSSLPKAKVLLADRGYDADWFRWALREKGIAPCIPPRKGRNALIPYDPGLYKQRRSPAANRDRLPVSLQNHPGPVEGKRPEAHHDRAVHPCAPVSMRPLCPKLDHQDSRMHSGVRLQSPCDWSVRQHNRAHSQNKTMAARAHAERNS